MALMKVVSKIFSSSRLLLPSTIFFLENNLHSHQWKSLPAGTISDRVFSILVLSTNATKLQAKKNTEDEQKLHQEIHIPYFFLVTFPIDPRSLLSTCKLYQRRS